MLKDGERRCDFCQSEIPKGERYIVKTFEKDEIPQTFSYAGSDLRLDICKDCQIKMRLVGEESVERGHRRPTTYDGGAGTLRACCCPTATQRSLRRSGQIVTRPASRCHLVRHVLRVLLFINNLPESVCGIRIAISEPGTLFGVPEFRSCDDWF